MSLLVVLSSETKKKWKKSHIFHFLSEFKSVLFHITLTEKKVTNGNCCITIIMSKVQWIVIIVRNLRWFFWLSPYPFIQSYLFKDQWPRCVTDARIRHIETLTTLSIFQELEAHSIASWLQRLHRLENRVHISNIVFKLIEILKLSQINFLFITCNITPIGCRPQIVLLYRFKYSLNADGFNVSIISMP